MSDETHSDNETIGIPDGLRVKRRYTMSEKALEQRRQAADSPNRACWENSTTGDMGNMQKIF